MTVSGSVRAQSEIPVAFPSATRLHWPYHSCAALEGAYVLEDRAVNPVFLVSEVSYGVVAPCRRARIPSRARPHNGWTADDARAPLRAAVGRHRRRQDRDLRRRAPDGLRAGS